MNRRTFLTKAALGLTISACPTTQRLLQAEPVAQNKSKVPTAMGKKLIPPGKGRIPVAVVISDDVTVIDFAGPWEVFADVMIPGRGKEMDDQMPFDLFTVAETTDVVTTGNLKLTPAYSFENVPSPRVVVVPAQKGSDKMREWLRLIAPQTDVTMSVCTGAFQLGRAGLLKGQTATTHHRFFDAFEKEFPDVRLQRGVRFVEGENISTAAGLSSGIDLALRVVERYFGRATAQATADEMEYGGTGWIV